MVIKRSTLHVTSEKPGAWFSSNQLYEATTLGKMLHVKDTRTNTMKSIKMDWQHIAERGGVFRVGVREAVAPVSWAEYKATSGIGAAEAAVMEAEGNPLEWFCSYDEVPMSR